MRTKLMIAASVVLSGLATPGLAQSADQSLAKKVRDPNEIVCERQEEIGSRLGGQKICKTRAEWAEERRTTRQDIDKSQTQRDLNHR